MTRVEILEDRATVERTAPAPRGSRWGLRARIIGCPSPLLALFVSC